MPAPKLPNADRLIRSTVRLQAHMESGALFTGSGLLMWLKVFGAGDPRAALVVITNKHVVEGAVVVEYTVPGAPGGPSIIARAPAGAIVHHPDYEVDLCAIPVPMQLDGVAEHQAEFISSDDIWGMDRLRTLTAIERIVMIGYPNGLIDKHLLYPIVRQGITATPAFADLHGATEFMIDCACFPGSSGSPVFLLDQGIYVDRDNDVQLGKHRFGLLGFLHAGPALNDDQELVAVTPPRKLADMQQFPLMMNLGNCVRAERLTEMYDLIARGAKAS